jgi:hypothetical protein
LVRIWIEDEAVSFSKQLPLHYLAFLDANLQACSLPAGKDTPDPNASENKWLERFDFYLRSDYDAYFDHADALALAGPSVKDNVTRYWQQNGKTHIRFSLNGTARDLRSWAKRRGIALQLTRQKTNDPVFYGDLPILRGKTAIPVFVVSPEGLTPARIMDFSGNWVEVVLENDTTPPVWAVIALRDPGLAKKAKVTRQKQLETQEEGTHYLEIKRGVLRLEFENDALPPLTLVARQLGFWESTVEMGEKEEEWIETEKTLRGSVWGTEIFIPDETYTKQMEWNSSAVFGRPHQLPRLPALSTARAGMKTFRDFSGFVPWSKMLLSSLEKSSHPHAKKTLFSPLPVQPVRHALLSCRSAGSGCSLQPRNALDPARSARCGRGGAGAVADQSAAGDRRAGKSLVPGAARGVHRFRRCRAGRLCQLRLPER